ncbi:hypothetical protein [Vibrio campbellii]|nr:hypothetical protein [Vibrio campbellii]
MSSSFSEISGKPSSKQYLEASIEDVIDRANKSSSESEIPFVTALFAAKANEIQKKTSDKMFWVAVISVLVALLSLGNSFFSSVQTNKQSIELTNVKTDVLEQKKLIEELSESVESLEASNISIMSEKKIAKNG